MTRIAILISGTGSNMRSLVEAINNDPALPQHTRVSLVLSNNPAAAGLQFAQSHNIETHVVDHRQFKNRDSFDQALADCLAPRCELILLAGFMRILGADLVQRFEGKILNIHPSLLPEHPGLHTHAKAIAAGDSHAGASVHFVTRELDGGPVILQARVPLKPDDTVETLGARVLSKEHVIYPLALRYVLDGSITYCHNGDAARCLYHGNALDEPLLLEHIA